MTHGGPIARGHTRLGASLRDSYVPPCARRSYEATSASVNIPPRTSAPSGVGWVRSPPASCGLAFTQRAIDPRRPSHRTCSRTPPRARATRRWMATRSRMTGFVSSCPPRAARDRAARRREGTRPAASSRARRRGRRAPSRSRSRSSFHRSLSLVPYWKTMSAGSRSAICSANARGPAASSTPPSPRASRARRKPRPAGRARAPRRTAAPGPAPRPHGELGLAVVYIDGVHARDLVLPPRREAVRRLARDTHLDVPASRLLEVVEVEARHVTPGVAPRRCPEPGDAPAVARERDAAEPVHPVRSDGPGQPARAPVTPGSVGYVVVKVPVPGIRDEDETVSGVAEACLESPSNRPRDVVARDGRVAVVEDTRDSARLAFRRCA
jgi:hypothetical protein